MPLSGAIPLSGSLAFNDTPGISTTILSLTGKTFGIIVPLPVMMTFTASAVLLTSTPLISVALAIGCTFSSAALTTFAGFSAAARTGTAFVRLSTYSG
jgi:hypothetical protein